jgi:hypothetical protein
MPDVRLKAPNSDFVAVTGSPMEAAQLRARGYTDVADEPTSETPQSSVNAPGAPSGDAGATAGGTSTPTGAEGSAGDASESATGDAPTTSSKPASGKAGGARR